MSNELTYSQYKNKVKAVEKYYHKMINPINDKKKFLAFQREIKEERRQNKNKTK